jgi:hypothetical protein
LRNNSFRTLEFPGFQPQIALTSWLGSSISQRTEPTLSMEATKNLIENRHFWSLDCHDLSDLPQSWTIYSRDISSTYVGESHVLVTYSNGGCRELVNFEDAQSFSKEETSRESRRKSISPHLAAVSNIHQHTGKIQRERRAPPRYDHHQMMRPNSHRRYDFPSAYTLM